MDINNSLLVAMMFIVLLTMGIGNIVVALATTVDRRSALRFDAIHTSWMVLLLLVHLHLFWQVMEILSIEAWSFPGFLYILAGPILLLFATNMMVQGAASESASDPRGHYFEVARQFFVFLVLLQFWAVGFDLIFGEGFILMSALSLVMAMLFLALAYSRSPGVHSSGIVAAWLMYVAAMALIGMGL